MINDFAQRLLQELQQSFPAASDLIPKKELRAGLQAALERMELVTREEFDAQAAVLQRTRARLETLEQQLAELQQQLTGSR